MINKNDDVISGTYKVVMFIGACLFGFGLFSFFTKPQQPQTLKFEVGDCIIISSHVEKIEGLESWEAQPDVEKQVKNYGKKITQIGNKNYKAVYLWSLKDKEQAFESVPFTSSWYVKVNCPKEK